MKKIIKNIIKEVKRYLESDDSYLKGTLSCSAYA